MTAPYAHLEAYLDDLAGRLRQLRIDPRPIVQEARDHLLCEVEHAGATSTEEAAARAVRDFGDAATVASRWALMHRADAARRASHAMTRRLIVIALLGHFAAFVMPPMITGGAANGEGTLLAELGIIGGALSGFALLVLRGLGSRSPAARAWLVRPTAGAQLRALVLLCGALGALGTAGLASRASSNLALQGAAAPAVAITSALAGAICLLHDLRPRRIDPQA